MWRKNCAFRTIIGVLPASLNIEKLDLLQCGFWLQTKTDSKRLRNSKDIFTEIPHIYRVLEHVK
jgi:hypothetical protein